MSSTSYRAGSWLGIVRNSTAIVLPETTDEATVSRLWDFLGTEPSIHGVLNQVTSGFGTELTGMPSFGIVALAERLHVVLRGPMSLTAVQDGVATMVSGRDVTTWSERSLALPDSLELDLEPSAGPSAAAQTSAGGWLPVGHAVLWLDGLRRSEAADVTNSQGLDSNVDHSKAVEGSAAVEGGSVQPAANQDSAGGISPEPVDVRVQAAGAAAVDLAAGSHPAADEVDADSVGASGVDADSAGSDDDTDNAALVDWLLGPALESAEDAAGDAAEDTADDAADDAVEVSAEPAGAAEAEAQEPAQEPAEAADPGMTAAWPGTVEDLGSEAPDAPPAAGEPDAESNNTTSYDHLWDHTVARSVEDAAVHLTDADELPAVAPAVQAAQLADEPAAALPPAALSAAAPPALASVALPPAPPLPPSFQPPVPPVQPAFQPAAAAPVDELPSGLIDSVPWLHQESAPASAASVPAAPAFVEQGRPLAQVPPSPSYAPAAEADYDSDHDGQTVMRSELSGPAPAAQPVLDSRPPTGPVVLARMCPAGHANPPSRGVCAACGTPLDGEARQVGRPRLGRMHISTGEVVELDHSLIVGRQPSVSRVNGGGMPRLVQVRSASGDISRSHVEIRLEGWEVLLVDLKATNGTTLVREGQPPRRLGQGEQAIVLDGDIAELGDGVSLLFEGIL
ncbi:FHA domain-containing protein [Arthrobacter sp. 35W]|uniref:FHA domain-containing protein n=1 Tax=Arthrobacter sp. 35W TaxID=1132441 RepID=UPI00041BC3AC|nr:FHA domain-containing protein [Arthrobacter sp. 35W]